MAEPTTQTAAAEQETAAEGVDKTQQKEAAAESAGGGAEKTEENGGSAEADGGALGLATHEEELTEEEINTVRDCESIGGDEEFMLMIIELLADGLDEKLTAAFESFPKDDWEGVWRQAHSIKGSSLQCSLDVLGNAAMEVELYFKKVDKDGETPDKALMTKMLKKLAHESRRVQNSTARLKAQAEAEGGADE
ncbi:Hypothetical Protein FCC1311_038442 [Hondaea fermentalgiana]|uniref:HPt domain-containing protein n=1 Tax=Hondaea fermentalgiana TaxID=2315210 RepID=A0A2R5GH67_9STRA|nr:Hypothetical Protein FCC1311_038442 [Hondaea fermentalgiana]|eukprot:GBG27621.1 Hypothetical Protein FCC1311_038442 [Hondaea fermentalgiana]